MDKRLAAYLRRRIPGVGRERIAAAMGISLATLARREVGGWDASEVIEAARIFKVPPLEALLDMGYLTPAEATTHSEDPIRALASFTNLQLVQEVVRRLEDGLMPAAGTHMSIVPNHMDAGNGSKSDLAPVHHLPTMSDLPGIIPEHEVDPEVWQEPAAADDPQGYTIEQEQEETEREP